MSTGLGGARMEGACAVAGGRRGSEIVEGSGENEGEKVLVGDVLGRVERFFVLLG